MSEIRNKFENMIAHIAFGLKEKLDRPNPEDYTYSLLLRQGINMFSALAVEYSGIRDDELKDYLVSLNETGMICKKFTVPVAQWFCGWAESVLEELQKSPLWSLGALIYLNEKSRNYSLTDECFDYLDASEKDLSAIDEHVVFDLMKQLSQEKYVYIRKFLIQHPLLTSIDRKELLIHFNNDAAICNIVNAAYQDIPDEAYCCPNCGWTVSFKGAQPSCCHFDCVDINIAKGAERNKIGIEYSYRLKRGVMRYICYPGKAELEIEEICKKAKIKGELWPELDRYDIKIIFPNGACWGVDAKTCVNPYYLSKTIETDNYFQTAGVDKGFYVIPDKIVKRTVGYLKICNNALLRNKKFCCITLSAFKKLVMEEVGK